jgi:type II pantothenate kinase
MIKQDELDSLVAGMQFVLSTVVGECFTFRPKADPRTDEPLIEEKETEFKTSAPQIDRGSDKSNVDPETNRPENVGNSKPKTTIYKLDRWTRKVQRDAISYSSAYPYMLVTIGTGVSVLRVDGPREHERVSGSTIGGGTFWGLMRLLTDVENFEHAMKLAEKGDPTKVDMMVGDIYGEDSDALEKLGLAADIVASSFGKLVSKDDPAKGLTQEDLARALLSLVTNNIGQVAYLNAKLHSTPRIYFVGSFLRHNMISQRRLAYAIDYWSKGEMEALFLEHEGYFGALGAFLMTQNIEKRDGGFFQWKNNS